MKVMDLLVMGNKQRTSEPTAANKTSSRSHAILQVRLKRFFGLLEGMIIMPRSITLDSPVYLKHFGKGDKEQNVPPA